MKESADKFPCSVCKLYKHFDAFRSYMCVSYIQVRKMHVKSTLPPCVVCRTQRERRVTA